MRTPNAQTWITRLGLAAHPEGGYYREVYRSGESVRGAALPPRYSGGRVFSTAIYYLLNGGQVSRFHRLRTDEIWHYYAGAGALIHALKPDGSYARIRLGPNPRRRQDFLAVLERGWWFGAEVSSPGSFVLAGCTMAPGFEFADFELARRGDLLAAFPAQRLLIERLTSPS